MLNISSAGRVWELLTVITDNDRIKHIRDAMSRSGHDLPSGLMWLVVCEACWQDFTEPCRPAFGRHEKHSHSHRTLPPILPETL